MKLSFDLFLGAKSRDEVKRSIASFPWASVESLELHVEDYRGCQIKVYSMKIGFPPLPEKFGITVEMDQLTPIYLATILYPHQFVNPWGEKKYAECVAPVGVFPEKDESIHQSRAARDRHLMRYSDYLQTEWWAQVRSCLPQRCVFCGRKYSIEGHHNTYARRGIEMDGDVAPVCSECHKKFHGFGRTLS